MPPLQPLRATSLRGKAWAFFILLSQLLFVKVDNRKKWGYNNYNYNNKGGTTMESGSSGNRPGRSSNLTTSVVCR